MLIRWRDCRLFIHLECVFTSMIRYSKFGIVTASSVVPLYHWTPAQKSVIKHRIQLRQSSLGYYSYPSYIVVHEIKVHGNRNKPSPVL